MIMSSDFVRAEVSLAALVVGSMSFAFPSVTKRGMSFEPMWPDAAVMKTVRIMAG